MITHDFVCDNCGKVVHDSNTKIVHKCPICSKNMRWDCRVAVHGNYQRPIHSNALAINPGQVEEHKKIFPNIRLDGQYRPIFNNFVDHEDYLKKSNMIKLPQKIKTKGVRIYGKKRTKSSKSSV